MVGVRCMAGQAEDCCSLSWVLADKSTRPNTHPIVSTPVYSVSRRLGSHAPPSYESVLDRDSRGGVLCTQEVVARALRYSQISQPQPFRDDH
jgi:hypothetical protein